MTYIYIHFYDQGKFFQSIKIIEADTNLLTCFWILAVLKSKKYTHLQTSQIVLRG